MAIVTTRLLLRPFRRGDLAEISDVPGNAEVMRFSPRGPYSREEAEAFIESCLATYESRGAGLLAVVLKENERVIGYCGFCFHAIDSREEVEIGYRLHPDHWNRGLATEAAKGAQDFGFEELGLSRMISIIEAGNVASIRVAEKCGMAHEKDALFKGRVPVRIHAVER